MTFIKCMKMSPSSYKRNVVQQFVGERNPNQMAGSDPKLQRIMDSRRHTQLLLERREEENEVQADARIVFSYFFIGS